MNIEMVYLFLRGFDDEYAAEKGFLTILFVAFLCGLSGFIAFLVFKAIGMFYPDLIANIEQSDFVLIIGALFAIPMLLRFSWYFRMDRLGLIHPKHGYMLRKSTVKRLNSLATLREREETINWIKKL